MKKSITAFPVICTYRYHLHSASNWNGERGTLAVRVERHLSTFRCQDVRQSGMEPSRASSYPLMTTECNSPNLVEARIYARERYTKMETQAPLQRELLTSLVQL